MSILPDRIPADREILGDAERCQSPRRAAPDSVQKPDDGCRRVHRGAEPRRSIQFTEKELQRRCSTAAGGLGYCANPHNGESGR